MSEINISNVSKWYGTKKKGKYSVENLNLSIKKGSVFGFLGPNGAGKTTTIKMIVGLTKPTSGTITIAGGGPDDMSVKQKIGFMPESPSFYLYLTGREFLEFVANIFYIKDNKEHIIKLLSSVELLDAADRQIRTYSKGMLQRLGLAQALINDPDILFLDEPTLGLDPQTRNHIWSYVENLNKTEGLTIFFSTHYIEEAERIAHRVAVIDHGVIVASGTPEELKARSGVDSLEDAFLKLTGKDIRDENADGSGNFRMHNRVWRR